MWFSTVLVGLWCLSASVARDIDCERASNGNYYRTETLFNGESLTGSITSDWENNRLFIEKRVTDTKSEVGVYYFWNRTYTVLGKLPGECLLTFDQRGGRLYAGCREDVAGGLYTYDTNVGEFIRLSKEPTYVRDITFADALYYTDKQHVLYKWEQGRSERVPELADQPVWMFVKNAAGDWVFTYEGRVYFQRAGSRDVVHISPDRYTGRVDVNSRGEAYAHSISTVYRVDTAAPALIEVMEPGSCEWLTFDGDDNVVCMLPYGRVFRVVRCDM